MARILIIDDEETVRNVLRRMLESAGYEVVEASDGEAGMQEYHQNPADIVIVDMFMPVKSGLEVIQELKRDVPDVKIIAVSGFGVREEPDMVSLALKYGALHAFEKPFTLEQMLNTVKALLKEGSG